MTEQAENIEAINRYILETPRKTPAAVTVRDNWLLQYPKVTWYDKQFNGPTYDWARNFRNTFDRANAVTAKEKQAVVDQHAKGLSSEQLKGESDRRTSSGDYVLPPKEKEPFFPTRVKVAAGIAALAAVALTVVKKLYLDPFLPRRRG